MQRLRRIRITLLRRMHGRNDAGSSPRGQNYLFSGAAQYRKKRD